MRIALAADHAGYLLKDELVRWLAERGHQVSDLGTNGPESVDYPQFGARVAEAVASGKADRGIAVCGSGIGIAIAVNRNLNCRCARVDDPLSAALAREQLTTCNSRALCLACWLERPSSSTAFVLAR